MRAKFCLVGVVMLVGAAVLGASTASAHIFRSESTVRFTDGGPTGARGVVTSARAWCERNRLVTLFYVQPDGSWSKIGSDRTDTAGRWRINAPLVQGTYVAVVSPKKRTKSGHRHVCGGDNTAARL